MNVACRLLGPIVLWATLPFGLARAAEPDLMAVLSVMGHGYQVKLTLNGIDPGIAGGKSENRRLFNAGNPMAAMARPEIRAKNFILRHGVNELAVEYDRLDARSADELDIRIEAEGYAQPLVRLTSRRSGRASVRFSLAQKAPADFRPVVIADEK